MGRGYNYQNDVNLAIEVMKLLGKLCLLIGKGIVWLFRKNKADKERAELERIEGESALVDSDTQAKFDRLMAKLDADLMEEEAAVGMLEYQSTK